MIDERPAAPVIADDRHLISEALTSTLVVEAAAGTGKTTELVKRVVRLIETETAPSIEHIVAVTFSEKAAGELKLRLREELERHRIEAPAGTTAAAALERAVQRFEEAHVSTIHGFCADLLRERPVEARIDPSFDVLTEGQTDRLFDEAFADWIQERLEAPGEGLRRALRRTQQRFGVDEEDEGPIGRVRRAAIELREWRDHPCPWTRPPEFHREREMDALLDALKAFAEITARPIDREELLYKSTAALRSAHKDIDQLRSRGMPDYDGWEARLCALAGGEYQLRRGTNMKGQYSKAVSREQACGARDMLVDGIVRFRDHADADVAALLHDELVSCSEQFEIRKTRAGALDFLDLLIRARDLVRDVAEVRREFQSRFPFILVDEFQDTDPLQAELLWMLAADEPPDFDGDPLELKIRPGGLFLVGDPKQSIYRFRRADVGVYRRVCQRLVDQGAQRVTLRTSFRSVPHIQRAVNAAFASQMQGDEESLQADYVGLLPFRPQPAAPSLVALPVPRPYGTYGITATAIGESLPEAVGEFVRWLVRESGWRIDVEGGKSRAIQPGDVCLLFRRLVNYRTDITRDYIQALESRGLPHLLVGGKAFHEREEVDALRTALTAIERPDDALSVFATLRGPFFAIGEEEMLAWHALGHGFRPYDVPDQVAEPLRPLADGLRALAELHRKRNYCPVAETIGRLLELTRAHAGFILWRGGEQVLANVLQIQELARQYEAEGGLSFRGFVDELRAAADRSQTPEAPILEEGTEGVRIMTVHKAKGLEFPVVILADIGCKLHRATAQRHLDASRRLAAINLAGWIPLDLSEQNDLETSRDRAEAVRLAYVAATRARDLLVVPATGDAPFEKGWVSPLSPSIYAPALAASPETVPGVPAFTGRDTVLERPRDEGASLHTIRPGGYVLTDPITSQPFTVVWWDPTLLDRRGDERRGLRREDLITKDARQQDVDADRARYETWRLGLEITRRRAGMPSMRVLTATEWARSRATAPESELEDQSEADAGLPLFEAARRKAATPIRNADVTIDDASLPGARPSGRRFGVLVHALLAAAPLDASIDQVRALAALHARVLDAPDEERDVAVSVVQRALTHHVFVAARAAAEAGRPCRREAPITIRDGDMLIDGQIDLAFDDGESWVVVDFKTDAELGESEEVYRRQIALYAGALSRVTGRPARATILRV